MQNRRQNWGMIVRRIALGVAAGALTVALGLALAACEDEPESSQAPDEPTATGVAPSPVATSPPATATAEAERRPWSFQGQRGITAVFPPADVELYRSLLPEAFDMPGQPLVAMTVVEYYDVTLPLVPYGEGFVAIECRYQGQTGWHVLTMPVDDENSSAGGRGLGFPKYVADQITLEEQEAGWLGRVVHEGRTVMEMMFTAEGEPVTGAGSADGTTSFQLVPPGEGPAINAVESIQSGERTTVTISGSATVKADAGEPWAGLLDPEGATIWAAFEEVTGYWWLEPTQLE